MATISPTTCSITLSQQRLRCVLDPILALSQHGLLISKYLGEVLELWVLRELWGIMDNNRFYLQHPDRLMLPAAGPVNPQDLTQALQDWEDVRLESDLAGLKLYWIGEAVSQSLLPDGVTPDVVESYEALAQTLERQHPSTFDISDPIIAATRDAIAATATLQSAFLLTFVNTPIAPPSDNRLLEPAICSVLKAYGMPCQQIDEGDRFAIIAREYFQTLIVQAGLSPLIWSGLNLAVLHLLLPNVNHFLLQNRKDKNHLLTPLSSDEPWSYTGETWQEPLGTTPANAINPWRNAQAFWFLI